MDKMKMSSPDLTVANVEKIAEMFPNVITEAKDEQGNLVHKIDFEKLKQELSSDVIEGDESYDFTWVGKKQAMVEANKPTNKTLRPCLAESVNWEKTENLYIEGDNLEVLKLLQESYLNKIKMIYIDPPYNTGNDSFVYNDKFLMSKDEYEEGLNLRDNSGNLQFKENNKSNPRFHSDWCSMIYRVLKLSRNLLSEDGVLFISIDEHELSNLQKILFEIFADNLDILIWRKNGKQGNTKKINRFKNTHEYIICAYKNKLNTAIGKVKLLPNWKGVKTNADNDIRGNWESGVISRDEDNSKKDSKNYYSITSPSGKIITREFFISKKKLEELMADNRIYFPKGGDGVPRLKIFEKEEQEYYFDSIIDEMGTFTDAKNEISLIFDGIDLFDTPKPVKIIKEITRTTTNRDSLILDFFSGSATTAHAVMQLNAEDGGNRKFIMVQLPEVCDEKSEAFKAGYKNICEIGKERIIRAGKKIKEEETQKVIKETGQPKEMLNMGITSSFNQGNGSEATYKNGLVETFTKNGIKQPLVDIGFRVLKLDESNMKDVYYTPDELTQSDLVESISNIKDGRSGYDLLYQCMLDWGLELSLPHETVKINNNEVHIVNDGDLIACFADNISEDTIKQIADKKPLRVVFRDSSFATPAARINVDEIFKLKSPQTTIKVL